MSATRVEPFRFKFEITTWGTACRLLRMEEGWSHRELGDRVGASKALVKAWENGDAYPDANHLKRLRGAMYRIKHYAHLLPQKEREADAQEARREEDEAIASGDKVRVEVPIWRRSFGTFVSEDGRLPPEADPAAGVHVPEAQAIDEPRTFHEGLRYCRLFEGLRQEDVAELMRVAISTVSDWELGHSTPVQENYDRLVELFDALRNAPRPDGVQARPKPVGNRGPRSGSETAPRSLPFDPVPRVEVMTDPPEVRAAVREILQAAPEVPAWRPSEAVARAVLTPLEEAGVAYARALSRLREARRELDEARARTAALEVALPARQEEANAALTELERLVGEVRS
jgi:transcriptional regulator with XRE-family HTH domain